MIDKKIIIAKNIVNRIKDDICDRGGLSDEWEMRDTIIKKEIMEAWIQIILDELKQNE